MSNLFEQIHIVTRCLVNCISIWSHFDSWWRSGYDVLFLKVIVIIFIGVNILIALVARTLVSRWFSFEFILTIVLDTECDWLNAFIVNDLLSQMLLLLTILQVDILSWVWLPSMSRFKSFPSVPFTVLLRVHNLIRHVTLHRDRISSGFDDQVILSWRVSSNCHVPLLIL